MRRRLRDEHGEHNRRGHYDNNDHHDASGNTDPQSAILYDPDRDGIDRQFDGQHRSDRRFLLAGC